MDLVISNSSGQKEITAGVDVINEKVIYIHHAGKTYNLRDQDVNIYKVDKEYSVSGAVIDDFVFNGKMSKVKVESITVLESDEKCE